MSSEKINVNLFCKDEDSYLEFSLNNKTYKLSLIKDEDQKMLDVYYEIINELFKKKVVFHLENNLNKSNFYSEAAEEFINMLNKEIDLVYKEIEEMKMNKY